MARQEVGWKAKQMARFGERWEDLYASLERDHEHLCYLNPFLPAGERDVISRDYSLEATCVPGAFNFALPDIVERQFPVVESDERQFFVHRFREERHELELRAPGEELAPFALAEGSTLVAASALQVEEGDTVLDACSSGITSLVLAGAIFRRCPRGHALPQNLQGRLVCNEMIKSKASRLQHTMQSLLPWRLLDAQENAGLGPRVVFTSVDMATSSNAAERLGPYDKILLGPPCSDDKAMVRGSCPGGLTKWSPAMAKVNGERQVKWLHNALWLLREGGTLLFFTRSLSPEEGDGVLERLFRRVEGVFELQVMHLDELVSCLVPGLEAEPSDWGAYIMPDKTSFGPMFFSRIRLLRRLHESKQENSSAMTRAVRLTEDLQGFPAARTTSFEHLPALKERVDELRKAIDSMNAEWAKGREAMEHNYGKVHELKQGLDAKWKAGHDALEAACTRLRDSLDKVGEDRLLCEEAQASATEGLPALFLKRFKDPVRFDSFQGGKIHGCTDKFGSDECSCPTGHEELGCQDSVNVSSFELKCSNILNSKIPLSNVLDFFKPGGACNISANDDLLKQVVDRETLHRLETSALPMGLAMPWSFRNCTRLKAARDFLNVGRRPTRRN